MNMYLYDQYETSSFGIGLNIKALGNGDWGNGCMILTKYSPFTKMLNKGNQYKSLKS